MKKQTHILVVILVAAALLGLAACGDKPTEQPSATAATATQPPKAQEESKPDPTATKRAQEPTAAPEEPKPTAKPTEPPPTPTPEPVEEELSLSALTDGLADLDGYRVEMLMTFEGKDEKGEPFSGTWDMVEETTRDPVAQRITMSSTGSMAGETGSEGSFEMITVGDTSYMITMDDGGERSCISFSSDEEDLLDNTLFSPDTIGGIDGAKYRGTEVVNGIRSKRYEWSQNIGPLFGFAESKGDVWVAVDGEYVVKYTAEASGQGTLLGDSLEEGKMSIEYNLTEVGGGLVIEIPADCEGAADDIPVMADAVERASFGPMMTYSSPTAAEDVIAFYKQGMPDNGWQEGEEGMAFEGMAILNYVKDARTAQVMITYDEDSKLTSVVITSGEE